MRKPVYYLWRGSYASQEAYEAARERFTKTGFRVVAFVDGQKGGDIQEGIKALIKNHVTNNGFLQEGDEAL